jgi:uncharacterized membrane protein affecting hemolysin expression
MNLRQALLAGIQDAQAQLQAAVGNVRTTLGLFGTREGDRLREQAREGAITSNINILV